MTDEEKAQTSERRKSVVAVLNKMYSVYQNMGITPEDRSINYVATNIVQLTEIIQDSIGKNRFFDKIEVEPSEICRPHSECWVVKVFFFRPETRDFNERKKFRITVDVSDVVPVVVGEVHGWHVR